MDIKPITREEMYLAKAAGQDVSPPEPITRKEMFLAKIAGMEVETPGAITRIEMFANKAAVALNRSVIEPLEITENGTYTAPEGVDGYSPVTVDVPSPEIKLQEKTITENGEYTADDGFDGLGKVLVEVAGSGGTLVAKKLTFTATGDSQTVHHGLGTVPLCAVIYPSYGLTESSLTGSEIHFGFAFNQDVASIMGVTSDMQYGLKWNAIAKMWAQGTPDDTLDAATSSAFMSNATETNITFGSSYGKLKSGNEYTVFVIGYKTTE